VGVITPNVFKIVVSAKGEIKRRRARGKKRRKKRRKKNRIRSCGDSRPRLSSRAKLDKSNSSFVET
jgi:adenylate kinase